MKILEGANLALRFTLELSALAAAVVFAVVAAISGTLHYIWD